jgi:hypothetical protein
MRGPPTTPFKASFRGNLFTIEASKVLMPLKREQLAIRGVREDFSAGSKNANLSYNHAGLDVWTDRKRSLTRGDVGNFPTCFEIAAHGTDGLMVDLGSLRDCPIGFLGRRLDQLGDQLALLLGGEMAATNVGADDVGIGIGAGLDLPARGFILGRLRAAIRVVNIKKKSSCASARIRFALAAPMRAAPCSGTCRATCLASLGVATARD